VHRLLRKIKIAEQANQSCQDPSRIHAIKGVEQFAYLLRGTLGHDDDFSKPATPNQFATLVSFLVMGRSPRTKSLDESVYTYAHYEWDIAMGSQRAHIVLPEDLIAEIDQVVGPRGRSAFLVETARAELRRRRLLTFLRDEQPAWKEKDHPELAAGGAAWVKSLRSESEKRLPKQGRPRRRTQ
jgi:hypothetical protein